MSEAIKPTPGPCWVDGRAVHSNAVYCIGQFGHSFVHGNWSGSDFATEAHKAGNAELFADALNVYDETQCTPRQLVERVKELEEALKLAEAGLADIGDADREPGDDLAWCERRAAEPLPRIRAALSKALPNTVAEVK